MASTTPTSSGLVRFTQATAIFLSAAGSGAGLAISSFVIPRLLECPTPLMLQGWKKTFLRGRATMPLSGAIAAASYFFLAYSGRGGRAYAYAGALSVGIIPYTLVLMKSTNNALLDAAEQMEADALLAGGDDKVVVTLEQERSAKYLVDHWGMLNLGRVAMLATASAVALAVSL
ncbi:hypothetical protein B0H63DRAFT_51959 [Podospora didyma]|uniref:DUF1772 domain-containing protein n=1 Tax=Podospora didyma TaxID=330526 RepID=A0AAE0P782_9PEZI|nr:hypothetical protein B0H63DRAFT_51959 [Podospora didyma]